MEFSSDGYLYVSIGDGGSTGDPEKRAQNLENLFGEISEVLKSNFDNYELILVNDKSLDDSWEKILKLCKNLGNWYF